MYDISLGKSVLLKICMKWYRLVCIVEDVYGIGIGKSALVKMCMTLVYINPH